MTRRRRGQAELQVNGRMRYVEIRCSAGVARRLDLEVEIRSELGMAPVKRSQLELAIAPASVASGSAPARVLPASTSAPAAIAISSPRTSRRKR